MKPKKEIIKAIPSHKSPILSPNVLSINSPFLNAIGSKSRNNNGI